MGAGSVSAAVLVKIGGSLMESPLALQACANGLADAWRAGIPLVLVHGGGKDINRHLAKLGEEPRFKDGLRVTSEAALETVEMTLSGSVNKRLVTLIQSAGPSACGLSGVDGPTLICRPLDLELGRVGTVVEARPTLVSALLHAGFLPVVSPISVDAEGLHYNVNADDAAAALAVGLGAAKLLFVSDVPGVLDGEKTLIPALDSQGIEARISSGEVTGGMIPKLRSCASAVKQGVGEVHICGLTSAAALSAQIRGLGNTGTIVG
jgi:acetylglutamate kinase